MGQETSGMTPALARPVQSISGTISAPGDKSCSHRALMLAAVAEGTTTIEGLLEGEDVLNTARAVAALGAGVERTGPGGWRVTGVGEAGFHAPAGDLDFGNSGTGCRLMMGLVGGYPLAARFVGDASLSSRPMERILKPLREMGVQADTAPGGRLPATLRGGSLKAIRYAPPEASAQVKSAVLLAGLRADGVTVVEEREATRDHTERMLTAFGVEVGVEPREDAGPVVSVRGGQTLRGIAAQVAGDPSSAAFMMVAGWIASAGGVTIRNMLGNRTRTGLLSAMQEMGAEMSLASDGQATGETTIQIEVRPSFLTGIELDPALIPAMIDELPLFAVLAANAQGRTVVTGAAELRVKESDRIKAICDMLAVNGVAVEERADGFVIEGCGAGGVPGGGRVETRHDHRIAMSALVMGTAARAPVVIDDADMIATSYPDFFEHFASVGADFERGAA
jgi:3-phosphoshikimate 1-carboxyvinyltransferase